MNTLIFVAMAGLIFALPVLIGFFHFLHVEDKAHALNGRLTFLKAHWPHAEGRVMENRLGIPMGNRFALERPNERAVPPLGSLIQQVLHYAPRYGGEQDARSGHH